jgi:hypothetical protein
MYNNKSLFVDNPINRYSIGKYTEGLKNNTDGSLDIYIQNANPGADKASNWLPADKDGFNLILRIYLPGEQVLNGTWTPPPVQRIFYMSRAPTNMPASFLFELTHDSGALMCSMPYGVCCSCEEKLI